MNARCYSPLNRALLSMLFGACQSCEMEFRSSFAHSRPILAGSGIVIDHILKHCRSQIFYLDFLRHW